MKMINPLVLVVFISLLLGGCSISPNRTLHVSAHNWNFHVPTSNQSKVITNQSFLVTEGKDTYLGLTVEFLSPTETGLSALAFITQLFGPANGIKSTTARKLYAKNIILEQEIDLENGAAFYSKDNNNVERIVFATTQEDNYYYILESKGYDLKSIFNTMYERI